MLSRKRKFIVAASGLVLSFVLALPFVGVVNGGQWVTVVGLVVGLYGSVEAAEGWAHSRAEENLG